MVGVEGRGYSNLIEILGLWFKLRADDDLVFESVTIALPQFAL